MALDRLQLRRLLAFVGSTREDEIACDECLADMAEFAEAELVGAEIPVALRRVEEHLAACPECADEYGVLMEALRAEPDAGSASAVEED
ncbi:MAG: hypothetical protein R3F21_21595 [Myxococcota bacterium]